MLIIIRGFLGGSEEAVPGPSVFPSGEPGVSGDFWRDQCLLSRLISACQPRDQRLLSLCIIP